MTESASRCARHRPGRLSVAPAMVTRVGRASLTSPFTRQPGRGLIVGIGRYDASPAVLLASIASCSCPVGAFPRQVAGQIFAINLLKSLVGATGIEPVTR